eukprot:CAMPEP_0172474466 /NCGR_PEP_ID=MMETSP1065-20121228/69372_1 /TAXON_ID=265537 /ORGANISM="Amphiprora paludosa, Strain CCMP125" /LENGTH=550 /DNA_ID=CAMNT_0013232647 /DNA_START=67 /DNA_END=1719 /DNA_ORIENTATION=+
MMSETAKDRDGLRNEQIIAPTSPRLEQLQTHDTLSGYDSKSTNYDSIQPAGHYSPIDGTSKVPENNPEFLETVAGVAGNVLEWYDFAVFGFFGDIIGQVFFPPQAGHSQTVESFAVFGLAFVMRPVGGVLMGYIGDVYGSKKALVLSIFLMAFPTFALGCLPSYERVGPIAIVLLLLIRLLQGLSVGGQLMSSLVFTLEGRDPAAWGYFASFTMVACNIGNLSGNLVAFAIRNSLNDEQLLAYGWRIPFLCGIIVSLPGFYLHGLESKNHSGEPASDGFTSPGSSVSHDGAINSSQTASAHENIEAFHDEGEDGAPKQPNPLQIAFSKENRLTLISACLVPILWSGSGYLTFVWLAVFMKTLSPNPIEMAFGINAFSLLFSICFFFPVAGHISDRFGRIRIMTIGGVSSGLLSPLLVWVIGQGNAFAALSAQLLMGVTLSLFGSPMLAWLVESFDPEARLTSVAIGYNLAQAIAGGTAPALATLLVDKVGVYSPGWMVTLLAVISLIGLRCVAPSGKAAGPIVAPNRFSRVPTGGTVVVELVEDSENAIT